MDPNEHLSDDALARLAKSGERDALEALLRRFQDPVYGLCLRWLSEPRLAADAASAGLVSFAEQLRASALPPSVLLYRRVVAECAQRGALRSEKPPSGDGDEARLKAALGELESAELSVLLLRDLVGLDLDQLAEVLEISRGAARSRLQRARLRLGRSLESQIDV